jgi:hypothetical protein
MLFNVETLELLCYVKSEFFLLVRALYQGNPVARKHGSWWIILVLLAPVA